MDDPVSGFWILDEHRARNAAVSRVFERVEKQFTAHLDETEIQVGLYRVPVPCPYRIHARVYIRATAADIGSTKKRSPD